jgi:hypothetical protein
MKKEFRSFEEARKYAQKLNLKSYTEWIEFRKSDNKPDDTPSAPSQIYEGWISWGDFLGTGNIAPKNRKFLSYDEAKKRIRKFKILSEKEFRNIAKNGTLPLGIPRDPQKSYKKEFSGWGDFLGTGKIANQDRNFLTYDDAKNKVKKLGITTLRTWQKAVSEGQIPKNIPTLPSRTYKKEWKGWGDFLGTGTIAPLVLSENWLSWPEAKILYRKIAKENNLKNLADWKKYCKTHKLPKELPPTPVNIYTKERVWKKMQE